MDDQPQEPEELHDLADLDFHLVGSQDDASESSRPGAAAPAPAPRKAAKPRPVKLETAASSHDRIFLLIEGIEHGPFELDDLKKMAAAGRLREHHQVRQGDDGEWLPLPQKAADLGLAADSVCDPALVASRKAAAGRAAPPVSVSDPPPDADADADESPASLTAAAFAAGDGESTRERKKRTRVPERWSVESNPAAWICLGIAALLLSVLAVRWLFFTTSDRTYLEAILPLYDEFQFLREKNSSQERWNAWVERVERVQSELVPALEATAGPAPHELARQHLLFALRDQMLPLLKDSRAAPGPTEVKLRENLETARALIAGEPPPPPKELPEAEPITPLEG